MKIATKITIGFASILALTLAVGGVGYGSLTRYSQEVSRSEHGRAVEGGIGRLLATRPESLAGRNDAIDALRKELQGLRDHLAEIDANSPGLAAIPAVESGFVDLAALEAKRRAALAEANRIILELNQTAVEVLRAERRRMRDAEQAKADATQSGDLAAVKAADAVWSDAVANVDRARQIQTALQAVEALRGRLLSREELVTIDEIQARTAGVRNQGDAISASRGDHSAAQALESGLNQMEARILAAIDSAQRIDTATTALRGAVDSLQAAGEAATLAVFRD
ncbi:MAG TPA: hypothetical protein PKZ99_14380, partial [Azospirillaceae bacterium]|nr:hypothetical protein [Azospirillaceae bacterium]